MAMILIYEPDRIFAHRLCEALSKENHTAVLCDENEHLFLKDEENPALVLMDARLKWTYCRPLLARFAQAGCPILFLTEDRQMSAHLRALYAGPCDVLALPFTHKALAARVKKLLGSTAKTLELSLDEKERVALLDGRRVELTAQECALLLALMEKPDVPISREQLLRKAWGYQSMGETRTVDVHVQRLRKKLGGEYIETVYKCGYRLKLA